jgi:hypothetical protein
VKDSPSDIAGRVPDMDGKRTSVHGLTMIPQFPENREKNSEFFRISDLVLSPFQPNRKNILS